MQLAQQSLARYGNTAGPTAQQSLARYGNTAGPTPSMMGMADQASMRGLGRPPSQLASMRAGLNGMGRSSQMANSANPALGVSGKTSNYYYPVVL